MNQEIPTHYEAANGTLMCGRQRTDETVVVWSWSSTTCEDCLRERRRTGRRWGTVAVIGAVAVFALLIGAVATLLRSDGTDEPMLSQAEIDQTIVASSIQATLRSVNATRTYPTEQARAATRAVENTRAAHAAVERRTRTARESALATKTAPAPRSVNVLGHAISCREIAYEYVAMAEYFDKITSLSHVSNIITIRIGDPSLLVTAHNAENALAQCRCFSPRDCKPLN